MRLAGACWDHVLALHTSRRYLKEVNVAVLKGELDLKAIQGEFDVNFELRVAAMRAGRVLASTVIRPKGPVESIGFKLFLEPPRLPNAKRPCPVRIYVGPNVEDSALASVGTLVGEVDFAALGKGEERASLRDSIDLGRLAVTAFDYVRWLSLCRSYTIHGRVVCRQWRYDPELQRWTFCDSPVPGATVEVYDVDRFLWFFFRQQIATAVTDVHGNFTIRFRWCCHGILPWLKTAPMLDPEIFAKVQELFAANGVPLSSMPPGQELGPRFLEELTTQLAVARGLKQPLSTGLGAALSAGEILELLPPSAELAALRVWPWFHTRDCAPDIVFRVTQICGGEARTIYAESNAQTRWNVSTTTSVTLFANAEACCIPACHDPECPECLKLQWIGCTPTALIGNSAGPPDLRGYGYVDANLDRPFYGALRVRGGVGWDVDYFKVQYSRDGGPWTDLPHPVFAGFGRSYWDGSSNQAVSFLPTSKNGQFVMMTRRHFEILNPGIPRFGGTVNWDDYDTLFILDTFDYALRTARVPDALYQFRFVGYSADAADNLILSSQRVLPTCGQQSDETVFVRIDNQSQAPHIVPGIPCTEVHACIAEPDVYIRRICVNEGRANEHCILACEIVTLNATDTLTIHFTVSVPHTTQDGHLGGYWMRAEYGLAQLFHIGTGSHGTFEPDPTAEVGPDYAMALLQGAPRPQWFGGDYKVTLTGADFPECCAYQIHLRAWKRTTDGCTDPQWIHANEFELAFTVLRPELCPNTCPESQLEVRK
jgi:hypothetical protein